MTRDVECKCCYSKAVGMYYAGLIPWGYFCTRHARYYKLTQLYKLNAPPQPLSAA